MHLQTLRSRMTITRYRVPGTELMALQLVAVALLLGSVVGAGSSGAALPFLETFETPHVVTGDLDGQNGWSAADAVVQTNITYGGSQAASLTSQTAFAIQTFDGTEDEVWSDLYIQPVFGSAHESVTNPPPDSTFVFYVNVDGQVVAYDGATPVVLSNEPLTEGEWVRFTVRSDHAAGTWDLHLNGSYGALATGLGFYGGPDAGYSEFGMLGAGSEAVVDDINIVLSNPLPTTTTTTAVPTTTTTTTAGPTTTTTTVEATTTTSTTLGPRLMPFYEPFEARSVGDLNGQNQWVASNAVVQTAVVYEGTKAGEFTAQGARMAQGFTDARTNVWTDLWIQPVFTPADATNEPPAGSTFAFYVDADGHVVAFDGTNETVLGNTPLTEWQWARFTVQSDYSAKTWELYLDNTMIAFDLDFFDDSATGYNEFGVLDSGGAYIDEIRVQEEQPVMNTASFVPASGSGEESVTAGRATVLLSAPSASEIRVDHYLAGGTAVSGSDFTDYTPGTLVFDPGETSNSFTFTIIEDGDTNEYNETIVFGLENFVNTAPGDDITFTYTILGLDPVALYRLPFYEPFEEMALGDIDGQRGWEAVNAAVQTNIVFEGLQAAELTTMTNSLTHTFVGDHGNVWTDMRTRPVFGSPRNVPDGSTFAFFVDTNGYVQAFDGRSTTDLSPSMRPLTEGDWVRFTVHSDYSTKKWGLFVNGVRTAADLDFYTQSITNGYSEFGVKAEGMTNGQLKAHMDNISITLTRPPDLPEMLLIIR